MGPGDEASPFHKIGLWPPRLISAPVFSTLRYCLVHASSWCGCVSKGLHHLYTKLIVYLLTYCMDNQVLTPGQCNLYHLYMRMERFSTFTCFQLYKNKICANKVFHVYKSWHAFTHSNFHVRTHGLVTHCHNAA